jgi:hypothetical protein
LQSKTELIHLISIYMFIFYEGQSLQVQVVNGTRLFTFHFLLNFKGVCQFYFYIQVISLGV